MKGLVLALLRTHGDGSSAAGNNSSGRPADALRPFLHDHAEHFWHELRCVSPHSCPWPSLVILLSSPAFVVQVGCCAWRHQHKPPRFCDEELSVLQELLSIAVLDADL